MSPATCPTDSAGSIRAIGSSVILIARAVARHVRIRLAAALAAPKPRDQRSEEHTSELQSLMRISYAVFCLKKKTNTKHQTRNINKPPSQYKYNKLHTKKN